MVLYHRAIWYIAGGQEGRGELYLVIQSGSKKCNCSYCGTTLHVNGLKVNNFINGPESYHLPFYQRLKDVVCPLQYDIIQHVHVPGAV